MQKGKRFPRRWQLTPPAFGGRKKKRMGPPVVFIHQPYDRTIMGAAAFAVKPPRWPDRSPTWTERHAADPESALVRLVVDYFRGYRGSFPAERVQNLVKARYPTLYALVVDARYRRRWHGFLYAHPGAFSLVRVPGSADPDQQAWRLCLAGSGDGWWSVDAAEAQRAAAEDRAIGDLAASLLGPGPVTLRDLSQRLNAVPGFEHVPMRRLRHVIETVAADRLAMPRPSWDVLRRSA